MPHFVPVQCHKCSVLQIKPAQKLGPKWCCSMCQKPEIKVSAAPENIVSDVTLFVEELDLPQEAEEMEAVANTFHGVENLDGVVFNWERLYFQSAKRQQQQQQHKRSALQPKNTYNTYEEGFAKVGGRDVNHRSSDNGEKRGGSQEKQFIKSLWGRWYQKTLNKDVVELKEFARGAENVPPCS